MIIILKTGETIDTETDLNAVERHIIQKLIIWKTIVTSKKAFAEKIRAALSAGWNNSGPVSAGPILLKIFDKLEEEVANRLKES